MSGKRSHCPGEKLMNLETVDLHVNSVYPHFPESHSPHCKNIIDKRINLDNLDNGDKAFQHFM